MAKNWQETIIDSAQRKKANQRVLDRHGIPSEPITIEDVIRIGDKLRLQLIEEQNQERLETQAKATWEARDKEVDEAEQREIRKVKEWIQTNKSCRSDFMTPGEFYFKIDEAEWQAFLKSLENGGKK